MWGAPAFGRGCDATAETSGTIWFRAPHRRAETWIYAYDPFGRRISKVRRFTEAERVQARSRFTTLALASADERSAWEVWASAPPGASALNQRPPVVGVAYQWDGDVVAEEALRLDGSIDWDAATRWHYEPEMFRPVAKEAPDGSLHYVVTVPARRRSSWIQAAMWFGRRSAGPGWKCGVCGSRPTTMRRRAGGGSIAIGRSVRWR